MGNLKVKVKSFLGKHSSFYRNVLQSGLFDRCYYQKKNPDVVLSGLDPLVHFISIGAREGRNPNPLFDLSYYRSQLPDLSQSRENPILHYCRQGALEGVNPHPLFHTSYYLEQCEKKSLQVDVNPLVHFLTAGFQQQVNPHPLFDYHFFSVQLSPVGQQDDNMLVQYLACPECWNIDPHPLFNVGYYKKVDPQVSAADVPPLLYYLLNHRANHIDPHPLFDGEWYEQQYPEIIEKKICPLVHYLTEGQHGRLKECNFEREDMISANLDAPVEGFPENRTVSVIVWGIQNCGPALSNLQLVCKNNSLFRYEVIVCSPSEVADDIREQNDWSGNELFPVSYCHYESSLAKNLQEASLCATGDLLLFLSADLIAEDQDWLQQFLINVGKQDTDITCAIMQGQGNILRQQRNQDLFRNLFGSIYKPSSPPSLPTAECMMVRIDLFRSLDGFNPLYEHYFFDLDFSMKLLMNGVKPLEFPPAVAYQENLPATVTDLAVYKIDKLLFVDCWQAVIDEYLLPCPSGLDLTGYMEKKRDEICRPTRQTGLQE